MDLLISNAIDFTLTEREEKHNSLSQQKKKIKKRFLPTKTKISCPRNEFIHVKKFPH